MNIALSRMRNRFSLLLLIAAVGIACSGGDDSATGPYGEDPEPTPDPDPGVVTIDLTQNQTFSPDEVTIEPGTTVRWTNSYDVEHSVTPDDPEQEGAWEGQNLSGGEEFEHTFEVSGESYTYHCSFHQPDMTGTITVE